AQESFAVPLPGHTLHLEQGQLVNVERATAFLQAAPEAEWPNRRYEPSVRVLKSLTPLTGKKQLPDEQIPELEAGLNELGRMLYGGPEFRALYSLPDVPSLGRKPTFALVLLADESGGAYVYEYEPQSSSFVCAGSTNPVAEYIAGCEMWATDLLALFQGEFGPSCLFFGNSRIWSAAPDHFRLSLLDWMAHFHPLRMPEPCLARYRRELRAANPHHHAIIQSNSRTLSRVASR
ncbi:MAG TPA: hypothetical protein VFQ61_28750, partial [Polyangiaceae bacterium]|nr:hypothetical protein [Polyangiaceae bacterium]